MDTVKVTFNSKQKPIGLCFDELVPGQLYAWNDRGTPSDWNGHLCLKPKATSDYYIIMSKPETNKTHKLYDCHTISDRVTKYWMEVDVETEHRVTFK